MNYSYNAPTYQFTVQIISGPKTVTLFVLGKNISLNTHKTQQLITLFKKVFLDQKQIISKNYAKTFLFIIHKTHQLINILCK
jgi:hypothetical protein